MDTKQQIKKYKIQLHELRTALNMAIEREQQIFNAEKQRIALKTEEFRNECITKSNLIKQEEMQVMEKLAEYTTELDRINKELQELHGHKFKLRHEVLNKIHAENRAKKDVRKNREVFNKQLAEIKSQIGQHTLFISKYDDTRRQINEDYYNWRDEQADTKTRISALQDGDKKKEILQKYLDELTHDDRAHPEKRYAKLEQDITQTHREIEHLGYQYTKLENYMKTFTESAPAQQELAISSYLRESGARIPVLKNKQCELQNLIRDTTAAINNFDAQMIDLANAPIPKELEDQTSRAHQRLEISGQRSHSEYDPLIRNLTDKILSLENQFVIELESTPRIETEHVQPSTVTQHVVPSSRITQVSDFTGKSRKEIERLKKQQIMSATLDIQSAQPNQVML